ncbi:MAG: response regulator [Candidatus Kerfeldbacteria bacterium]|nr:response regulator [Candidatus Kerfeldbacteria bacterium]
MATVLIIEDERPLRASLRAALEEAHHTVLEAGDGEMGLALVREQKPDLILLDIILPKKDGLSLLETLHLDPTYRSMPVIMLSNLSDDATVREATGLGAREFLVKTDVSIDDILTKVSKALGSAK